jgi:hypothetical protein
MTTADARHVPRGYRNRNKSDRLSIKVVLNMAVSLFLIVTGCNRQPDPRSRIQLHDVPETTAHPRTVRETTSPSCPPGNSEGNEASSSPAGGHSVNLSWSASPSSSKPNHGQISYCLYRTKGRPVQSSGAKTVANSPCVNCQRVTIEPILGTTYKDTHVENDAHYCYVAIAIENKNILPSPFSNQADAMIPPRSEPPFCRAQDEKAKRRSRSKRRH